MDSYSFNINTTRELRLRRHIREVLLPYARTHLTSDYVAFTEKVVEELILQTLEYVPMADATSFLLPTEPFDVLMRSLHSLDLTPPEERWATPSEHVRYLRTLFPPPFHPHDLPIEKCWYEDDHYAELSLICRPMSSPILSKRARRETPKLGSTNSRASMPRTNSALAAFLDLKPVPVQGIDLPAPPVDEVLDLRLKFDSATHGRVRSFLQSVLIPPMKEKSVDCFEDTPHVPEILNHHSPPRCLYSLDSPPLFPRIAQGLSTPSGFRSNTMNDVSHPTRVSDLASMLQVASPELIDGEDGDINSHHMEVVSGWTTLKFSSPPPPSPHSSDRSEVDELWRISPPGTPATSLMAAKMDEVEIPRIRKFGHKNTLVNESTNDSSTANLSTVAKRLVENPSSQGPGFFITSFISAPIPTMTQAHKPITSQLEGIKSGMHSPRPLSPGQSTSNSLLGQPPSAPEEQANGETLVCPADCVEDFEEQRFDDAIASIYISTPQDPLSYIREEKLTDKDIILMDVPNLPPPTAHPKELTLFPEGMQSFVALKGDGRLDTTSHENNGFVPMAFLKPVKGIKPLALDLSWRPFNFGKTIPTDEEVAGIAQPIQLEDEVPGYCDEKYEETARVLLELGNPPISASDAQLTSTPNTPRGCEEFGTSPAPKRVEESGHLKYLLTQRERMRASGAKTTLEAEVEVQDDVDTGRGIAPWSDNDERRDIQDENLCQHEEHQGSRKQLDLMEYGSRSRSDYGYSLDDSGIDIMDNNLGLFSTSDVPLLLHPLQDDSLYAVDTPEANKENVDDQSENKENVPPRDVHDYQLAEYQPDSQAGQYDRSGYLEFPESETPSFEPLSFASQSQLLGPPDNSTNSKSQDIPPLTPSLRRVKHPEDDLVSRSKCEQTNSRATKRRKLDDLVPASSKDLFSTFIGLRNQAAWSRTLEHSETGNDTPTPYPYQTLGVPEQIPPRAAPDDVFDQHTVRLPEHWIPTALVHRYLASMTLIQKRGLVRELQGHQYRVVLVERYDLGGTDIIIDPDYGVLFIPLLALPAHLESAVERISRESWRYLNLLIVFEAFPSSQSYRADHSHDARLVPYAYTPPICKAIKKLRRNLGIAEGCDTMNPRCTITWAFANDTEEAAKFVRCFGEEACTISTERGLGILWDEREWLEEEEREGESDLARVHGMNAFAAFVMLYDRSLETILDLSPEARLADFGQLLGQERMMGLNAVIESRMQQIAPDIMESVVDPGY